MQIPEIYTELARGDGAPRRRVSPRFADFEEPCGGRVQCRDKRLDVMFTRLLYVEWIAAIVIAAFYTPLTGMVEHVSRIGLLAFGFITGGVSALSAALAERLWRGQRRSRIIIGVAQIFMVTVIFHLVGSDTGMDLHLFASLAILAFYADALVLISASAVVILEQVLHETARMLFLDGFHVPNHIVRDTVWMVLCNLFVQWIGAERRRESRSVAEQKEWQQELLRRAFYDRVTGMRNRAALESHIDELLERGTPVSCLLIEADGLRAANEMLGHRGGDALIRSIARRVQDCAHHDDVLGRFGSERFLIVVDRPFTRPQLGALAESIVQNMAEPHILEDRSITTSVSIGIAEFPADTTDREGLLAAADRSLHAVKCEGRNTYRFAGDMQKPDDERNSRLSAKLQRAMLEGGLHIVYQPIFTSDEIMVATEALTRWRDPEEGMISPGEFIPVAEATGLIVPLSNWVLRSACEQMVHWVKLGTTLRRMAVNVSVKQVWRSDFVGTVERTLLETGLDPCHLELEVTEGALATDFNAVKNHLGALRQLGVRISIDDFGTGYSSLSRVRELDADVLKVDRSFIQGASETPNGIAVVQAIVDMAHRLRLAVIAEGVETTEQLEMVRNMNCDEVQGYLLARPQPAELLTALLHNAGARPATESRDRKLQLVPRTA